MTRADLAPGLVLAVSVEPAGGSPGPVILTAALNTRTRAGKLLRAGSVILVTKGGLGPR